MRILFNLAGGPLKASSRVRGYWIAEALEQRGHQVTCTQVTGRNDNLRLARLIGQHDVVVFQKAYGRYEPLLVRWAHLLDKRVFFDIDDAPSRASTERVKLAAHRMMRLCDGVLAGSSALVSLAQKVQPATYLIPSGIRLDSYSPRPPRQSDDRTICLGWIGNGAHYAEDLVGILGPVLRCLAPVHPLRLRIVGACGDRRLYDAFQSIDGLSAELIDEIDWNDSQAVNAEIAQFDIGLYPLKSSPFNDFKCGFKALEYMAMGLPVLASDAANHAEIVVHEESGLLLHSQNDWQVGLTRLAANPTLRRKMGATGRRIVEQQFDTAKIAVQLERFLSAP